MKAKPSHRYYTAERGAKFTSGDRVLVLRKNDLFRLSLLEGRPCVIKDGIVYSVNKRLVRELKRRSEDASVAQVADARIEFLNLYGIDIEKAIVKNTQSLVSKLDGTSTKHAFKNSTVWLAFDTSWDKLSHSVMVVVQVSSTSVQVAIHAPDKNTIGNWKALPLLELTLRKLSNYLSDKYGIEIGKPVARWATYGNVQVAGKPFSGRVLSYSANWSL